MRWNDLAELLAPSRCGACGRSCPTRICSACHGSLTPLHREGRCRICHAELRCCAPHPGHHAASSPCATCRAEQPALDAIWAPFSYEGPVLEWMHRFKYPANGLAGFDPEPGALIEALILEAVHELLDAPPDAVVPIPLHVRRLRARGFNPAAVLAGALARRVGAPVDAGWLIRRRDTPRQTGLGRAERHQNVADAFTCRPRRRPAPRSVWLVDDVVTTRATLQAAAEALAAGGADHIVAICAARTPTPRTRSGSRAANQLVEATSTST